MTPRGRYILRMVAANIAATVFVAVAFFGVGFGLPWRGAAEALGIAFLFSLTIGTLCAVFIPRISPRLWRCRFPINWLLLVTCLFAFAMAGSTITIGILAGIGYIPAAQFAGWLANSARYAIVTTLTFGIAISAYELMRSRLEAATLAVRTKERDEAEARRAAIEAQLASLESRVQPHFLFNTLNSIASLIPTDPHGAERMTAQLASLLRSSLDGADTPLVPLALEIKTVRDYLDIERVRFGERIKPELTVEPDAEAALVPRFSLQTLVENSVKYAIAPRRDGGRVAVRAAARDGRVRIEVEDDGTGFDPETIPANHGLALLRQRLAFTYGDRATMHVHSAPGRTVVIVEIPGPPEAGPSRL
jgi:two-component system, LytTR family, sensor histidine kinase AlgZ